VTVTCSPGRLGRVVLRRHVIAGPASAAASRAHPHRAALVAPHERAGVLSLLYIVSYLASRPAVIAGYLVVHDAAC